MMPSFFSPAQIANLERVANDGYLTLEAWTETDTIAIGRQGIGAVGTFDVAGIRWENLQPGVSGFGEPLVTTERAGTLKLWTADVTATPVHRGDRFLWNGQACIVSTPPDYKRGGVAEYGFTVEARNP